MKNFIKTLLEENYCGIRERKNKAIVIRNLVIKNLDLKNPEREFLKEMSFDLFHAAIMQYKTWDREWQDVTLKYSELRGDDYGDDEIKEKLQTPYKN